ncbi:hypothetical protein GCM10011316_19670 [Roseibium aquae]|uniref:Solute-binding protein family 3/N-terminal domain-containing protein n=1 Tax=Roseibium aquae TaxID=1323746 RepID=A0A916TJ05_9HYPH|nr:transporter substrate-binding domain-containing protein [Roseibium aquae]GGB47595.1 hypothetical protein GCM10011316_19670 [Roseibium aquae]
MRIVPYIIGALITFAFALQAASEATDITVVTEDLPPFSYIENNEVKGVGAETIKALLTEAGLPADLQFMPWARAYHTAQVLKNTVIFPIARTRDREDLFTWIGTIAPFGASLYRHVDRDDITINRIEDARDLHVGVYIEDAKHQFLRSKGFENLSPVDQDILNIRKLTMKRLDLIAIDDAVLTYELNKLGMEDAPFVKAFPIAPLSGYLYVAVHKDTDPALVQRLRTALETIKENGIHKSILADYGLGPLTN